MSHRVYVASSVRRLREAMGEGVGPAPFLARAVTAGVRTALAGSGEEDCEYAVATAAAAASVLLIDVDEPARRVVLAVDVPAVRTVVGEDPSVVEVAEPVPFRRVAAVLVDSVDAETAVGAARAALRSGSGSSDVDRLLDRVAEHELGWWAGQEAAALLAEELG